MVVIVIVFAVRCGWHVTMAAARFVGVAVVGCGYGRLFVTAIMVVVVAVAGVVVIVVVIVVVVVVKFWPW
jgi:hypothetical protein